MDHLFHHGRVDQRVASHNRRYLSNYPSGGGRQEEAWLDDDSFDSFGPVDDNTEENNIDISLSAPVQAQWYHGRLDRETAEKRLQSCGRLASYLVRESVLKDNSYVLSYFGSTGINHFRINAICGDYFLGGRKFASLSHLIGYYTSYSDLLKKERLCHPVQPPEPVSDYRRVIVIYPYETPEDQTDELSIQRGDILEVRSNYNDRWFWCFSHRTRESGLVFKDFVEELEDSCDPNEMYAWFHSCISKEKASEELAKMGPGSFLVKPSERSPGNYSLFFYINNTVQRFRIEKKIMGYSMGGRYFDSLDEIIKRYQVEQITEGFCLRDAVLKAPMFHLKFRRVPRNMPQTTGTNGCQGSHNYLSDSIANNNQDVYATLREVREEQAKKKQQVNHHGYLDIKSKDKKKWKNLFIELDAKEYRLSIFVNDRVAKPKSVIDLSCSYVYTVHDSLFERPFCFQVVERSLPCISTNHYFCAESVAEVQRWIRAIRPLCTSQQVKGRSLPSNVTEIRTLYLHLLGAKRLPVKLVPHPYCIFSLNQVKVGRTQVKSPPDPVWEEDFILEDIPADIDSFSITVLNKAKRNGKDSEVAEVTVELSSIKMTDICQDLPLTGLITPVREDWGSMRIRVRYVHELVLPLSEYESLKGLVMNDDLEVISFLGDCAHKDRASLAAALLSVFRYERKECPVLRFLLEREIKTQSEKSVLFRTNSLVTSILDQYMHATCRQFLEKALGESLRKIMETRQSCELNPSKLDNLAEACSNAEYLLKLLDEVADLVFHSVEHCPPTLRFLCGCLQRAVAAKWPDDNIIKTRVVGSFIFLRLICPATLNPACHNLIEETPSDLAGRTLILIAKALQNLANLVEFGTKEAWMEVVNPFILKNKAKMIKFLDDISMVYDCPPPDTSLPRIDPSRGLATIHAICEEHFKEILKNQHDRPTLRRLATVTEKLSATKKRLEAAKT